MTKYPQILLPKKLLEALTTTKYTKPTKPVEPNLPEKESSQILTKLLFLIIGIGAFFLSPIIGILLSGFSLYLLFSNNEAKEFDEKMKSYIADKKKHYIDLQNYNSSIKISNEEFNSIERRKAIKNNLSKTVIPTTAIDYKKGASHDYFKEYLKIHFEDLIIENATIKFKIRNYNQHLSNIDFEEYRNYIPDFAYVNHDKKLCIAIEIDEPYTLIDKTPIHLNDGKRNDFFIQNNWSVIRFAEEQIVLNPSNCCHLIRKLIESIIEDNHFEGIPTLTSKIESVPKWTASSVNELIRNDHRKKILAVMAQNEQNKKQRLELEKMYKEISILAKGFI